MIKKISLLLLFIPIISCGNNPPELKQVKTQLNYIYQVETKEVEVEFSLMINIEDEDGDEDIESVYLINDKKEVYWSVDKENLNIRTAQGIKWLCFEHFKNVNGEVPYPGTYRLLIIDRAGERDETTVFLPMINKLPEKEDFPLIKRNDNQNFLEIISTEKNNIISFFDEEYNLIEAVTATPGFLDLNVLSNDKVKSNCKFVTISTYSNLFGGGFIYNGLSL